MSNQPGFIYPNDQGPYAPQQQQPSYPQYPSHPVGYPPQPVPGQQPFQAPNVQPASYLPFPQPIQNQIATPMAPPVINWFNPNSDFVSYLSRAKALQVGQKKELLEILVGWESPNKYSVRDENGNKIFYVGEESNICGRQLCSSKRSFRLDVKDRNGATLLMVDRGIDCNCCFGLFCPDSVTVSAASGQVLGYVKQNCSIFCPSFSIQDANGNTHLTLTGPMCVFSCFPGQSVTFQMHTNSGQRVGQISKEWSNIIQELFTDADNFYVSFPPDLDVSLKAVCMAAAFLIDFRYFENKSGPTFGNFRS